MPLTYHKLRHGPFEIATVNVADWPAVTVWLAGCVEIEGTPAGRDEPALVEIAKFSVCAAAEYGKAAPASRTIAEISKALQKLLARTFAPFSYECTYSPQK